MSKFIKYTNITFKANTGVFVGTLAEFANKFNLSYKDVKSFDGCDGTVIKVTKETKQGSELRRVIWLKHFKKGNTYDLGVFIHELSHLVFIIAEDKGITVKLDTNNETYCYLIEELFKHFYTKLVV